LAENIRNVSSTPFDLSTPVFKQNNFLGQQDQFYLSTIVDGQMAVKPQAQKNSLLK
jgi:hypothetical protein